VEAYAILCQQTSPKRRFGNVNMTSICDVINSLQQIQLTTIRNWMKPPVRIVCVRHWIRHCLILEFTRGASSEAAAPGITRSLHATVRESVFFRFNPEQEAEWTFTPMQVPIKNLKGTIKISEMMFVVKQNGIETCFLFWPASS